MTINVLYTINGKYKNLMLASCISMLINNSDKAFNIHIIVSDFTKFDYDFDLVSGRYVIDAKSIMGIFSLDLSKPIDLNIHAENQDADNIIELLKPYLV